MEIIQYIFDFLFIAPKGTIDEIKREKIGVFSAAVFALSIFTYTVSNQIISISLGKETGLFYFVLSFIALFIFFFLNVVFFKMLN